MVNLRDQWADTSFNIHFYDFPFMKEDVGATWLGVAGSPVETYNFFKRDLNADAKFFTPYQSWGFTPETGKINNQTPDTDTGQNWQPSPEPATQNRRPAADADRDTGQNGGKTVKLSFDKDAD